MMRGQKTICGAKTRKGCLCSNLPMKNGRCRMHGGKSTGPKQTSSLIGNQHAVGNKSKLLTGEYETITWERLEDSEREHIRQFYQLKPDERVMDAMDVEDVRMARMMKLMNDWDMDVASHIQELLKVEDAMTRVSNRRLLKVKRRIQMQD